jgi:hypothetical protein
LGRKKEIDIPEEGMIRNYASLFVQSTAYDNYNFWESSMNQRGGPQKCECIVSSSDPGSEPEIADSHHSKHA